MDLTVPAPSLVVCPHPLLAAADRRIEYSTFLPGESIAAHLDRLGIHFGSQPVVLRLNDRRIEREDWARTLPRQGDLITVRARVRGGDGLRTVLSLAVMLAAPLAGAAIAGSLGLGTAFTVFGQSVGWGSIIGGVISIGGNLLINAVLPPPSPNLTQASGRIDNPSPTYSLAGGANQARPYEPLPLIMGTHRVFPDLGAKPYTEFEGDDQYLYQIFNFGLSDVRLTDFRIGNTPISSFDGVTIQRSDASGKLTLFPANVDTVAGGPLTFADGWIERTSSTDAQALAIEITGALYYVNVAGEIVARTADIRMEYRRTGDTEWLPFALGTATLYHEAYWSAGHWERRLNGGEEWVQVDYGSTDATEHLEGEFHSEEDLGDSTVNNAWRLRPYAEINGEVPGSELTDPAPPESYQERTPAVLLTSDTRKPLRLTYRVDVDPGQYDVRVRRVTPDETDPQAVSDLVWSQLRTYQPDTADYGGQRRVAIKIRASGQLQGTMDRFSALASSRARAWDGEQWGTIATSNPAWWFLHVLRGRIRAGKRVFGCGLTESRIDVENVKAFAKWCDARSLTIDAVFDRGMSCFDMLSAIARCGRASLSLASGRYGVVWDAPDQPVVAVFGPGNIRLDTFRSTFVSERLADEIEVVFINPDLDWQQDTVRAVVPGVTQPVNTVRVELFGCTNKDMAGREANLIAAAQRYRRRFVTFEADFEGRVASRGDVVLVSHTLFASQQLNGWGRSGRLVAGSTDTLTLDAPVPFTPDTDHHVAVRAPDGTLSIRPVVYQAGESAVVELESPLPAAPSADPDGHPAHDYLWFFGLDATGPAKRMKVSTVEVLSEFDVRLTLVDEGPEYYASEEAPYTYVPPGGFFTQYPVLSGLTIVEELLRTGNAYLARLTLTWDVIGNYSHATVRAGVNGAALEVAGSTPGRRFELTVPPRGVVQVEVTGMHPLFGAGPQSRATATHTLAALAAPPADVPWFSIDGDQLTWGAVDEVDVVGYRIRFHYGVKRSFGDATPMHTGRVTASPFTMRPRPSGRITILIVAVDALGNISANPAVIITDLGDPIVANLVETIDLEAQGWPGEVVDGVVSGTDLVADDATDAMWNSDADAAIWTYDSADLWHAAVWKDMYYLAQITPRAAGTGAKMTLAHSISADAYSIEYRRNGPGPMWSLDAEAMWDADAGTLVWQLPPGDAPTNFWTGDDGALIWAVDDAQRMWTWTEGGYEPWPGEIMALNEPYDIRVHTAFGYTRGTIDALAFTIDMPDIVERLNDIDIDAAGTRLPITQAFRVIRNVNLTLQDDGGDAVAVKNYDKSVELGPLVRARDVSGTFANARIDATIQGY